MMTGFLLSLALIGQTVAPSIVGPDRVAAGRLVVLSLDCPEGAKTAWRVFTPEKSGLSENDCTATFEMNRRLAFASPVAGTYQIVAAVSYGDEVYLLSTPLVVEDNQPPSPPNPDPDPGPGPRPPSTWAEWADRTAKETVPDPFRITEGPKVGNALRVVADATAAGRLTEPRKAREAARQSVREALGTLEAIKRWQPFAEALDAKMDSELGDKATLNDYIRVWTEVANGLEGKRP